MTTLTAVHAALDASASEHAASFRRLLGTGSNTTYKSLTPAKRKFGSSKDDFIQLGRKSVLFERQDIPSLEELQQLCLRDWENASLSRIEEHTSTTLPGRQAPEGSTASNLPSDNNEPAVEDHPGTQIIRNLKNPGVLDTLGILSYDSEALDAKCSESWSEPAGLLLESIPTCTILPKNTAIPLHHNSDGTRLSTLISGSVVWIIWPSATKNLNILQTAYDMLASSSGNEILHQAAALLEAGVIFVQNPKDSIRIPAFCPMMALVCNTAVVVSRTQVTHDNFIATLHNIPFLRSWLRTEVNEEGKRSEFIASLLRFLDLMLNGDPEDHVGDSLQLEHVSPEILANLLKSWDEIKLNLAAMMNPTEQTTTVQIWTKYLVGAKGRQCRICSYKCFNKNKFMATHFVQAHWVAAENRASPVADANMEV